jgi:hypothetical protein
MKIEKIYVINLNDKIHRWNKNFKNIDERVQRIRAIDSRNDYSVCEQLGLKLSPVGLASKLYFSQASGAVGAYCSHYLIWETIIRDSVNCALVLEDDANVHDVIKYLKRNPNLNNGYDFCQLNKRFHSMSNYFNNLDGFESYLISNKGARILKESTLDHSHFSKHINFTPLSLGKKICEICNLGLFKKERNQDWSEKNTISCPVDKFAGFCANPNLPNEKRIKISFDPQISLFQQNVSSDIMLDKFKPWHNFTNKELLNFMNSEYYEYWKHGKYKSIQEI